MDGQRLSGLLSGDGVFHDWVRKENVTRQRRGLGSSGFFFSNVGQRFLCPEDLLRRRWLYRACDAVKETKFSQKTMIEIKDQPLTFQLKIRLTSSPALRCHRRLNSPSTGYEYVVPSPPQISDHLIDMGF